MRAAGGPAAPARTPAAPPPGDAGMWLWLVPVLLAVAAVLCYLMVRPPSFFSARSAGRPPRT